MIKLERLNWHTWLTNFYKPVFWGWLFQQSAYSQGCDDWMLPDDANPYSKRVFPALHKLYAEGQQAGREFHSQKIAGAVLL